MFLWDTNCVYDVGLLGISSFSGEGKSEILFQVELLGRISIAGGFLIFFALEFIRNVVISDFRHHCTLWIKSGLYFNSIYSTKLLWFAMWIVIRACVWFASNWYSPNCVNIELHLSPIIVPTSFSQECEHCGLHLKITR